MSRHRLQGKKEGYYAAVGLDRPMSSWFFQLYAPTPEPTEEDPYPDDSPTLWKDTRSNWEIVALIKEHCDMSHPYVKQVCDAIADDLDPDEVLRTNTTG